MTGETQIFSWTSYTIRSKNSIHSIVGALLFYRRNDRKRRGRIGCGYPQRRTAGVSHIFLFDAARKRTPFCSAGIYNIRLSEIPDSCFCARFYSAWIIFDPDHYFLFGFFFLVCRFRFFIHSARKRCSACAVVIWTALLGCFAVLLPVGKRCDDLVCGTCAFRPQERERKRL